MISAPPSDIPISSMETKKLSVENVLCMKGGNGETSYAHNSLSIQIKMVRAIKPILESSIEENIAGCIESKDGDDDVFRIADLGCATGINTLLAADTIAKAVKRTCIRHSIGVPEFQVYFNDLPSNDFNSLLRMLPPYEDLQGDDYALLNNGGGEELPQPRSRCYFAAAVTGSFYTRLFPRRSLNFVHSSLSLHWLSKVPESVEDKSCDAWNGGRIFISREAVGEAYLRQFSRDLTAFLRCRAEEIIPHGSMLLAFFCRDSSDILQQDGLGIVARHLEAAFDDLVTKGLIEEERLDSFNLPFFGACVDEFKSIVERENSFYVERLRILRGLALHPVTHVIKGEEHLFGKIVGNHYRSLFENIVGAHLGSDFLVNQFFYRIEERATVRCEEYLNNRLDLIVAFLILKS